MAAIASTARFAVQIDCATSKEGKERRYAGHGARQKSRVA
jgi:hypothetical protein